MIDSTVIEALGAVLRGLGANSPNTLPAQLAVLTDLKSKLGRKPLAEKLGLNEHELAAFESTLADVQRWQSAAPDAARRADFLQLASFAALQWLEVLCPRVGAPVPDTGLEPTLDDDAAAAQLRALELVLRELIHESYRGQSALLDRLGQVFKPDTLAKWNKNAAGSDVLSGMSFGELATFFVSKDEYPRYQPLLEVEQYLAMMRERRKTLRSYLDALRLTRNTLAHHKPLSVLQRLLVEHFAREIFAPVSLSWREGKTAVNPENHLLAPTETLHEWLSSLTDDVREVQEELSALKDEVASARRDVSALEGAVVLILLSGLFFLFTIAVTAWTAVTAQVGPPDLQAAAVTATRSARGLMVAAFTFGLAVLRILLNVTVFRGGAASGLRGWISGRRALLPLGLWIAAGLAFHLAPIHLATVETPFLELDAQASFLQLDEAGVERYLARGGNPNAIVNGNTLIHLTILGVDMSDAGWLAENRVRKVRIVQRLLQAGAKPSQADRDFAHLMQVNELYPLLEAKD